MKKTVWILMVVFGISLLVSGCSQAGQFTEEEQNEAAEYIAHMVLKHDQTYQGKLQEKVSVQPNPGVVQEEFETLVSTGTTSGGAIQGVATDGSASGAGDGSEAEEDYIGLNDVFAKKGFEVKFVGYERYSEYPEEGVDGYFSLTAPEGKTLAVMKFRVTNQTGKELKFSQLESELKYRLDLDEKTFVRPSMTLLMNDLQYMDATLAAGESQEAVVVFTVDEGTELAGANLLVYEGAKTAIEKLN